MEASRNICFATLPSAFPPCLLHKSIIAGGEWGDEFVHTIAETDQLHSSPCGVPVARSNLAVAFDRLGKQPRGIVDAKCQHAVRNVHRVGLAPSGAGLHRLLRDQYRAVCLAL